MKISFPSAYLALRRHSLWRVLTGITILASFVAPARAASFAWNGNGADDRWNMGPNWTGGVAPDNNGTADLLFTGAARLNPLAEAVYRLNSLTFDNAAGNFSLSGGSLILGAGGITQNSGGVETINNSLILGAAQNWRAASGTLTLNSSAAINNAGYSLAVNVASGTSVTLNGPISGAGGLSFSGGVQSRWAGQTFTLAPLT